LNEKIRRTEATIDQFKNGTVYDNLALEALKGEFDIPVDNMDGD